MPCGRIKGEDDGGWEGHGYARLEIFGGPKFRKNQEKQEKAGKTIEKTEKNKNHCENNIKPLIFCKV